MTPGVAATALRGRGSGPGDRADRARAGQLLLGTGIDSLGSGLSAGAAMLYFVTMVGLAPGAVTLAMSAGAVLGILTPVPVGRLADRYGLVRVYVGALVLRGVGVLCYATATSYPAFFAFTLWLMALETTTFPLQQSLLGAVFEEGARVRLMTRVRAVRSAAFGVGAVVAGLALASGSRSLVVALLMVNGASFLVLAWTVLLIGRAAPDAGAVAGSRTAAPDAERPAPGRPVLKDLRFLGLCLSNGLLSLHETVLLVLMPLWLVVELGLSPALPGLLTALYTGLTVVLQLVLGRLRWTEAATGGTLLVSGAFLAAACLVCAVADGLTAAAWQVVLCVLAVVLLTVGENLQMVAAWQTVFDLAPPERRGEYMGAFNTGSGVQSVIGPTLTHRVVLPLGPAGWLLLAGLLGGAAIAFGSLAKGAQASRTARSEDQGANV
ncbi:MFS transporter [Streptomyces zaomyceticus]|uniref:MFS transporter n=1 Tax=Streptomyces zaomyceticus TaxID=68286 RepID=UPI002E0EE59C|nr:MFS transporter [Streptomyces zaomyceticus]